MSIHTDDFAPAPAPQKRMVSAAPASPQDEAIERAIIASRQYAKAQRSFFRGRMRDWHWVGAAT